MRQLTVEYDNLSRPDGSAAFSQGETVVQGAVYGPCEVRASKELESKTYLEVVYYSKVGSSGVSDRAREQLICSTLESVVFGVLYPRTSVTVVLQEMTDDGSLLSACFNAAMLALLDVGISLRCTVAAISAVILESGDIQVDPNAQQEKGARCHVTFVFESTELQVLTAHSLGSCSQPELQRCQQACKESAGLVFDFYRNSVLKRHIKEIDTND